MKKLILALIFVPSLSFGAQITINIPEEVEQRVLDAFAIRFDFDPNDGLTKGQFAKQKIIEVIKNIVIETESRRAGQAAAKAKKEDGEEKINLD